MPTITGDNGDNTINGTSGEDEIFALGGDDLICPGDGNDTVYAGDGNDYIFWTGGSDVVDGGLGQDVIWLSALDYVSIGSLADGSVIQGRLGGFTQELTVYSIEGVVGTQGSDSLVWDENTDETRNLYLNGLGGDDLIRGGLGNDEIVGGENDSDTIMSSRGNDRLEGGFGGYDLVTFSGSDAEQGIVADLGAFTVTDEYGDTDTVIGFEVLETLTPFIDTIYGSTDGETIRTGGYGDTIHTGGGDDYILVEGAGDFDGGAQTDTIEFSTVGLRVDPLTDESGRNFIYRNAGIVLNLETGIIADDGFAHSGTVINFENVYGTDENDDITGSDAANVLLGNYGDDLLYGLGGDDTLNGGDGNDTVYGGTGDDTLFGRSGTDHLFGGDGNDTLSGGSDRDFLFGGAGNDILKGGSASDTLLGGDGNDQLLSGSGNNKMVGGHGADLFLISGTGGAQLITDFNPREDRIRISTDLGPASFADLTMVQDGKDVLITYLHLTDDSLRLQNVTLEMLNVWNFEFAYVEYADTVSKAPANASPLDFGDAPSVESPIGQTHTQTDICADLDTWYAHHHDLFDLPHHTLDWLV